VSQNSGVCIEALDERIGQSTTYFSVIDYIWEVHYGSNCGRTNLNYTGSSALILSREAVRTQPHFKRCNPVVCQVKSR
jgi:hypothetical protein